MPAPITSTSRIRRVEADRAKTSEMNCADRSPMRIT